MKKCEELVRRIDEIKLDKFLFENVESEMKKLKKLAEGAIETVNNIPNYKDEIAQIWTKIDYNHLLYTTFLKQNQIKMDTINSALETKCS